MTDNLFRPQNLAATSAADSKLTSATVAYSGVSTTGDKIVLSARNVCKSFKTPEGGDLKVLENINLELREGEIVALLGRSGSGKSTLLRCLVGLVTPTSGEVRYRGRLVTGSMPGMAMVFQTFALLPWLTVQQNVELGLQAQGVPKAERQRRALEAIDLIGLDGFESAFPKELSGGMRQRVGFARALVTNPDVLLMDEPFSALDVLTGENLRAELLELWQQKRIPTRAILMVTHNIEEAVQMADRVLVLARNPGRIQAEVAVKLPRPRDRESSEFRALVERIYNIMTTPPAPVVTAADSQRAVIGARLPQASIEALGGLIGRVAAGTGAGRANLSQLARDMQLEIDDLFPLTDAAELLGLAHVKEGDIILLPPGKTFATGDIQDQKRVFREQLIAHVPLVSHIQNVLATRADKRAPEDRFIRELEDFMSTEDAEQTLATAIDWGRYAEIYSYDFESGILSLDTSVTA